MDKENEVKLAETMSKAAPTKPYAGVRSALGDLSENVPIPSSNHGKILQQVKRSVSCIRTQKTHNVRSKSDTETKVKFCVKTEHLTKPNEDEILVDEVFVKGEEHYLNLVPVKRSKSLQVRPSHIPKPLPVIPEVAAHTDVAPKPAKGPLLKTRSSRSKRFREEEIYKDCLYDEDLEDNYRLSIQQEAKFVYRKSHLQKYVDFSFRISVISWLSHVQQVLHLFDSTFLAAIRMFDFVLIARRPLKNKYSLVGLCCLWITAKNLDVQYITVPKIEALCNSKFTKKQIKDAESEILKAIDFNASFPEPTPFLYIYLRHQDLHNDPKIRNAGMFLLEIFTIFTDFSSQRPSYLASLALHIVLQKFQKDDGLFLELAEQSYYIEPKAFLEKSKEMADCVKEVLKSKEASQEIVRKYSSEEKLQVAKYFLSA